MESKELICTITDKKMIYNIKVGANVVQAVDSIDKEFAVRDIVEFLTTNSDGEEVVCTNLISDSGEVVQTLSPTVQEAAERLYDTFDLHEEYVKVRLIERTNPRSKRKFLSLDVL